MFTVYLLACSDGTYHSGVTKNLEERIAYHHEGTNQYTYTFSRRPLKLVFQTTFNDVRTAIAYEEHLKSKSHTELRQIINGELTLKINTQPNRQAPVKEKTRIIIPLSYLGNLAYFDQVMRHDEVILDIHERFQKQSYRSRCTIYSANGLQNLIVPVIRPNGKESLMSEILVSYAESWQKDHLRAIESAYRRAPFYDYYAPDLFAIIQQKHERLIDLNYALTLFLLAAFGIESEPRFGTSIEESAIPLKNLMNPKLREKFNSKPYRQVLNSGNFEQNLSLIDVLFNAGKSFFSL